MSMHRRGYFACMIIITIMSLTWYLYTPRVDMITDKPPGNLLLKKAMNKDLNGTKTDMTQLKTKTLKTIENSSPVNNSVNKKTENVIEGKNIVESQLKVKALKMIYNKMDSNCSFSDDMTFNIQKLERLRFNKSATLLKELALNTFPDTMINTTFPVIITGANAHYYMPSQGLIKSVHQYLVPKYPGLKLIYYDLGLSHSQREQLVKHCQCEVRTFQFDKYPDHVKKLKNYSFKPIIVKTVYQEYGYVWWADSSIRFLSPDIDAALSRLEETKVWFYPDTKPINVVPNRIKQEMFDYFEERPCRYLQFAEIQGNSLAFKRSHLVDVLLDRWVSCAIDEACIDPPGAYLYCPKQPEVWDNKHIGACHRYDQAIMNIMLWRLFHEKEYITRIGLPRWMDIKRGQHVTYFPAR